MSGFTDDLDDAIRFKKGPKRHLVNISDIENMTVLMSNCAQNQPCIHSVSVSLKGGEVQYGRLHGNEIHAIQTMLGRVSSHFTVYNTKRAYQTTIIQNVQLND